MSAPLDAATKNFEQVVAEAQMHFIKTGDKDAARAFVEKADEVLARAQGALAQLLAATEGPVCGAV